MIALIDGDSIAYILGWIHKENQDVAGMHTSIDVFLDDVFTMTGADMYFGALASDTVKCWRYELYRAKPYKGGRLDDLHMLFWKPIVKDYLREKWKFQDSKLVEADDLIAMAAQMCLKEGHEFIVCSPDKDLRQLVGRHYDYRTQQFCDVDEHDALLNLYTLMIEGDKTDNIMGIPGKGEKQTKEKLHPLHATKAPASQYYSTVFEMYKRHFGEFYGKMIFEETLGTVRVNPAGAMEDIQIHAVPEKDHPFLSMNKTGLV
jgi:hypothetical protein